MSSTYPDPIDRFRRPEYTGENRCMPCTIFNSAIAVVLSAAVGGVLTAYLSPAAGLLAGTAVLGASALTIALRGYLVPKTPYITKTYFPERVLAYFEKEPPTARGTFDEEAFDEEEAAQIENDTEEHWANVDASAETVEEILQDADALEECENVDDLCVVPSFREAWRDHIVALRDEDTTRDQLATILDADPDELEFHDHGGAFVAKHDRKRVGKWESEAAFIADMAAARTFENQYDEWETMHMRQRSAVLNGIRVFLEVCPVCDGVVTFGEETVESCCREQEIMAVACEDCDARLFEAGYESPNPHP